MRSFVQFLQQIEAGAAGHLDIEKQQLRLKLFDLRESFLDIARLAHDFDLWMRAQQPPQFVSSQALIVDDQRLHALALTTGIETSASTNSAPSFRSTSDAASPYNRRSLWRMF